MGFLTHRPNLVGLDISDHVLRLVRLRRLGGSRLKLLAAAEVAVPEGVIVHGDIIQADAAIDLIRTLRRRAGRAASQARHCVASLPEPTSFLKLLRIAPSAINEFSQDVMGEAAGHLPMAAEEAYIDWQRLTPPDAPGPADVLLAATPRQTADRYIEVLTKAGLEPLALELEPIAIGRAVLNDEVGGGAEAVLDLGGTRASFAVFRESVPQFTVSLPIAGVDWTKAIAEGLRLDAAQAEEAKVRCGLSNPACDGALADLLAPSLDDLQRRLAEALGYYEGHFEGHLPVRRILLAGGGAQLLGLGAHLSQKLGVAVELARPLRGIAMGRCRLTPGEGLQYATALGLARRTLVKVDL